MSMMNEFAGVVARAVCRVHRAIESLRGQMGESTREVDGCLKVCWRRVLDEI